MKNIAINGLGRIRRLALHQYLKEPSNDITIVAANDLTSTDDLVYLLKYDSVYGVSPFTITHGEDSMTIKKPNNEEITVKVFHEKNPEKHPWDNLNIDIVLECTGVFRRREDAAKHLCISLSVITNITIKEVGG